MLGVFGVMLPVPLLMRRTIVCVELVMAQEFSSIARGFSVIVADLTSVVTFVRMYRMCSTELCCSG